VHTPLQAHAARLPPPLLRAVKVARTELAMTAGEPRPPAGCVDLQLFGLLLGNQVVLGAPVFAFGGWRALAEHGHFDSPLTWLVGAVGALPVIALGRAVETSRSEAVVDINWATELLALKLFGYRKQPIVAGVVSLTLAALVGTVEETTFRGLALPALGSALEGLGAPASLASTVAIALTTAVFAILHLNPRELRPSVPAAVTLGLQSCAGFWFALLAIGPNASASTTDWLGAAIIAHALYDFSAFYGTHMTVANQYEFAVNAAKRDTETSPALRGWAEARGGKFARDAAYLFHFLDRDFSNSIEVYELRLGLHSYGIDLSRDELAARWATARGGGKADLESDSLDLNQFITIIAQVRHCRAARRGGAR
jgi:membrane protease YdiL (CAAX protease family)